jgi:hypothetical protein
LDARGNGGGSRDELPGDHKVDAFISYSHLDREFALALRTRWQLDRREAGARGFPAS